MQGGDTGRGGSIRAYTLMFAADVVLLSTRIFCTAEGDKSVGPVPWSMTEMYPRRCGNKILQGGELGRLHPGLDAFSAPGWKRHTRAAILGHQELGNRNALILRHR